MAKPKIAIYDFTDCEGCEVAIISLREKLLEIEKFCKQIYGESYKQVGIDAVPLSSYVKVDFLIHGCPVNPNEFIRIIEELLAEKKPQYRGYSVCFECKQAGNPCQIGRAHV